MQRPRLAILLPFLALSASPALSRPMDYQANVRDSCRQTIAGAYLKAYDERERIVMTIAAMRDQEKAMGRAVHDAQSDFNAADQDAQKRGFDVDLAAKKDAAASVLAALQERQSDATRQRQQAEGQLAASKKEELRLRALIDRVFTVARDGDLPDGGYPRGLTYRAACPKFRALCPLPVKDADLLLKITIEGGVPEACTRYAAFTRIP